MQICVEIFGEQFSVDSEDLSDYMAERLLRYGLKQALQDAYASLTEKSGKTDEDRLVKSRERYAAIVNDDRTAWREGGGGGKPLDPVTEKVREIVRDRAKDLKVFSTLQALDKAIVQNIGTVYVVMATRTVAKTKEISEAHAAKVHADLIALVAEANMKADLETAAKMVEVARMERETEKELAADLVAELEAKLKNAA